jgi:hypothetical protein
MISLLRANEIRRLIDEHLRTFTILDIRRADRAVFAMPWVMNLTPEERNFDRNYREQKLTEIRARFPRSARNAKGLKLSRFSAPSHRNHERHSHPWSGL